LRQQIVEIHDFDVDQLITEHLIVIQYHDRPGIVGVVGRILGDANININSMQVSQDSQAEHSLMILGVESEISAPILTKISTEIGAHFAKSVDF
jgi:D-3-phosphoglycerate dehydrogenase